MTEKLCKKCGVFKELSSFWKAKGCKDGHRNKCIDCEKIEKHKRYLKNRDEIIRKTREYRAEHLEEDKKNKREYYLKHRDETIERVREWEENNSERKLERNKKYRKEKPHLARERQKRYRDKNKEKGRCYVAKRRSLMKKLPSTFTENDWKESLNYFNYECAYCGNKEVKLEQEHIIPASKRGAYIPENIVPACKSCNSSKLNRDFKTWYRKQDYYSIEREEKIKSYVLAQIAKGLHDKSGLTKYQIEVLEKVTK